MPDISGSCRCGKVKFNATADPIFSGICHCRSCQKDTGSAFSVVIAVPDPSLTIHGTLSRFDSIGDSGQATHRRFCPSCGSTVTRRVDIMDGVTMLCVGLLDDPDWVKPTMQIYCNSAQPWVALGGDLKRFPKMPM